MNADPTALLHAATKQYVDAQVGGVDEFIELIDTPASYTGSAKKAAVVNSGETALEFVAQTLDQAYDNQPLSGARTITVDDGDIVWNLTSPNNLTIQFNGTDVFRFNSDFFQTFVTGSSSLVIDSGSTFFLSGPTDSYSIFTDSNNKFNIRHNFPGPPTGFREVMLYDPTVSPQELRLGSSGDASVLVPNTDGLVDLGTSSKRWGDIWVKGAIRGSATQTNFDIDSVSGNIKTKGTIEPLATDNTVDLGATGNRFKDLWLAGNLRDGANSFNLGNVLLRDGTTILTANWDAGSFEIRAQTFQSDVVTGTSPLIVASTTVVANLNAALLDGNPASAFSLTSHTHALNDLSNVSVPTPVDNEVLTFDSATSTWESQPAAGGDTTFIAHTDTPASYATHGLKYVRVNTGETALEFIDLLSTTNTWDAVQTFATTTKLQFRDTGIFIHSNLDGEITIEADIKVNIGVAGDIELGTGTLSVMRPNTDNKIDFGTASFRFNKGFFSGDQDWEDLNIVLSTTTGTKIGTSTTQKLGFYNVTPVNQPAALAAVLTTITHTAPGTDDFAIQDLVDSGVASAFGFASKDEGNTVLKVIRNLQQRQNNIESRLQELGLIA